jgi:hypothetical protein
MPAFNVALQTRPGSGPTHDAWISDGPLSPLTQPTWLAIAHHSLPSSVLRLAKRSSVFSPRSLSPEACLAVCLNPTDLTLACAALPETPHYFRLADATVKPLPPNPEPFALAAGDAYIALTPSALQLADSPAMARFIHLRDYFNAQKLASALLNHLTELAPGESVVEDVTVLVIEVR